MQYKLLQMTLQQTFWNNLHQNPSFFFRPCQLCKKCAPKYQVLAPVLSSGMGIWLFLLQEWWNYGQQKKISSSSHLHHFYFPSSVTPACLPANRYGTNMVTQAQPRCYPCNGRSSLRPDPRLHHLTLSKTNVFFKKAISRNANLK